jgi:RNA polymerase primary sigma factor
LSPENKYSKEEIDQLISKGRKQGYLSFEEIDKTFHDDIDSDENFQDFLSSMDDYGIKILDSKQRHVIPKRKKSDLVSIHGLERTTDPVKLYLREMGNISLLTREGEISIAKEIERGEKTIIKALSKTRLVLNEVLSLEDRIKENPFVIQEMFDLSEDEISEGKLEEKTKQILSKVKKIKNWSAKLDRIPQKKENKIARGRIIVKMSNLISGLNIRPSHREKIIRELRGKLRAINELEEKKEELNVSSHQTKRKKENESLKEQIKEINSHLRQYHKETGLNSQGLRKIVRSITMGKKTSDQAKKELVAANLRLVV